MRIKPYSDDFWYYMPKPQDPDADYFNWVNNYGEFSLSIEEAFQKHFKRKSDKEGFR